MSNELISKTLGKLFPDVECAEIDKYRLSNRLMWFEEMIQIFFSIGMCGMFFIECE